MCCWIGVRAYVCARARACVDFVDRRYQRVNGFDGKTACERLKCDRTSQSSGNQGVPHCRIVKFALEGCCSFYATKGAVEESSTTRGVHGRVMGPRADAGAAKSETAYVKRRWKEVVPKKGVSLLCLCSTAVVCSPASISVLLPFLSCRRCSHTDTHVSMRTGGRHYYFGPVLRDATFFLFSKRLIIVQ